MPAKLMEILARLESRGPKPPAKPSHPARLSRTCGSCPANGGSRN
jgi:hypothetical protein